MTQAPAARTPRMSGKPVRPRFTAQARPAGRHSPQGPRSLDTSAHPQCRKERRELLMARRHSSDG